MPEGVQGWDRYGYVNNNPVRYNDPSGYDVGFSRYLSAAECLDKSAYTEKAKKEIAEALRPKYSVVENTKIPTINPTFSALQTEVANYYKNPFNPTWTPMSMYKTGPTSTPKPFDNFTNTSQSSHIPVPYIYIDPNQVDYLNVVADVSGMVADVLTIASLKIPILAPAAETAQEINAPIEAIGLTKSVIDLTKDMPSGFTPFLTKALQNTLVIGARSERLIPVVGFIGNAVSLYFDLKPQIIWH